MRRNFITFIALICIYSPMAAAKDYITQHVPEAQKVGEGSLSKIVWHIYDATLYAPKGKWSPDKVFALSLRYFQNIKGQAIADRSVQEMRGQGFSDEVMLATWHAQMKALFPDVKNGTVLSAVFIPGRHTEFFEDNRPIGIIKGDAFIRWFSGIWLNEKTSEPHLRQKLLGLL